MQQHSQSVKDSMGHVKSEIRQEIAEKFYVHKISKNQLSKDYGLSRPGIKKIVDSFQTAGRRN
jgi:DNA-binding transcriptional regulator LsrR (DeoR family)